MIEAQTQEKISAERISLIEELGAVMGVSFAEAQRMVAGASDEAIKNTIQTTKDTFDMMFVGFAVLNSYP